MVPHLYQHQSRALSLLQQNPNFGLLMEMGTGKTRVVLEEWRLLDTYNLLVIAPKSVYRNWEQEMNLFLEKDSFYCAHWSSSKNKYLQIALKFISVAQDKPRALLMNVEALSTVKAAKELSEKFLKSGPTIMVVDESTRIRNYSSLRTKCVIGLGEHAAKRRILSGLITPRSPMDLYSQFYFLNWKILGARNFYTYRARYAIMKKMNFGGRNVDIIVGYKNMEDLQSKIQPYSYRVLKEECLDLPPKIYTERSVELSAEQRKAYEELRRKAVTILSDGQFVTSTIAVGLLDRLHQILCGQIRDDQDRIHDIDASPRDNELFNALDEIEGKTIIWAPYRHTLRRLIFMLKEKYGETTVVDYWGDTTDDNREIAKQRFQEDPHCRFFVGNPSTGGLGITLHAAKAVIYYANSYDLEHRMQSEDRAHRAGLDHPVTYIDLVAKGTIDEKILESLKLKINLATQITGEKVREWIR